MSAIGRWILSGWCAATAVVLLSSCESGGAMTILDVAPRVGAMQGDQPVNIIGQNFRQDIGYTIYFGTKKTSSVTIRDPETIQVVTPPNMPEGTVDIMIRADDGNAFKIAEAFAFKNMGGNINAPGAPKVEQKGNLAY